MAEQKLTLKQSLAAIWQQAETTFATKTDVGKVSTFAYGVSSTAVGTAAKVITLQGVSDWTLKSGAIIAVSFTTGTNTANNPTFNVNGTGAKRVKYNGALIASADKDFAGTKLVQFYYYDGSNWVWFFRDYGDEIVIAYYKQADKKLYTNSSFTGDPITPDTEKIYLDPSSGLAYVAKDQSTVKPLGADNVVRGYYNDNKFYLTRSGSVGSYTYSNEVDYNDNKLYIDKGDGKVYTSTGTNVELLFDTQNYYTKAEVADLIAGIKQFSYELAATLPTASASTMYKIYLIPSPNSQTQNAKDEYITIQNGSTYSWEQIGSTTVDLTGYATETWVRNNYVEKVSGKGLSTNDYTTAEKNKLSGIASGAQVNVLEGVIGYDGNDLPIDGNKKVTLPNVPASKLPDGVKNIVTGYYKYNTTSNKGEFFSDSAKTTPNEVGIDDEHIFKDLTTNLIYVWDGSEYVLLNGDYFAVTQTELNEILGIS